MQAEARAAAAELGLSDTASHHATAALTGGVEGLSLRALVEDRWKVAPQTAAAKLAAAGLPVEGRRAKLVYSWSSILLAEGIEADVASVATRDTHPDLFEDLLKPKEAASRIGFKSDSAVRKLVLSGVIPTEAYVAFGTRGQRHYRPAFIEAERRRRLHGRLV